MVIEAGSFEYNLFLVLTIIIITTKIVLGIYLAKKILDRKKEEGKIKFDFLIAIFLMIIGLLISRILYSIFDFYLTGFDPNKYYLSPNIWFWKIAGLIAVSGLAVVLFVIDKKILGFKLKGLLAYIILAVHIIVIIYPVNSTEDFELISTVSIVDVAICIVIPAVFLYVGIKAPDRRKVSFMFAFGVIIYMAGVLMPAEFIVSTFESAYGSGARITLYMLFLIFKTTGLSLAAYAATKLYE